MGVLNLKKAKIICILFLLMLLIVFVVFFIFKKINKNDNRIQYKTHEKNSLPISGKIIFLDPGHGGADPGATYQKVKESDINLKIILKLKNELEKNGAVIFLTRDGDYDLSEETAFSRKRSDLVNRAKLIDGSFCDLYLSIHLNADTSSKWYGPQVFYDDINSENEKLAQILQQMLNEELRGKRGIKQTGKFYMNRNINKAGVLIEAGFLSNPDDRHLLKKSDYQSKIAKIITKGVIKYFNEKET